MIDPEPVTVPVPECKSSPLLDETRARDIRDMLHESNPRAYKRMLDNLARDLSRFSVAMQAYAGGVPIDEIKHLAHSLKGGSLGLGAQALGELFSELERLTGLGDMPAAERLHAASALLIAQSENALRQLDAFAP